MVIENLALMMRILYIVIGILCISAVLLYNLPRRGNIEGVPRERISYLKVCVKNRVCIFMRISTFPGKELVPEMISTCVLLMDGGDERVIVPCLKFHRV